MQPVTTQRVFSERYELTHLIARGGMAQVYRARDRLLDRPVALKVLFPELSVDRAFVERFRREAQAAANLSHPNIVPVFDWGEDGGTYFIVMEFIDGQPLSAVLRAAGPLPPARVAHIGSRVADALSYAHRHGVVHRDVKPGNVLLTDDEQVKVTDFGIARAINTEESLTQTGAVMGTAAYFSPEQAEGIGVDARSDIYSLGVVLYEMVAGRPPFLGETPVSIASKHVRDRPPVLSDLNPTVPPALEAIIARAMAKSPDDRYQTAGDLRADLQRFAEGRPVLATTTVALPASAAMGATGVMGAVGVTGVTAAVGPLTQAVPLTDGHGVPPAPRRRSSASRRWGIALVLLLVVLAVVVYFLLRALGDIGGSSFTLPSVAGQTVAQATDTLKSRGLTVAGQTQVVSTQVAAGTVIRTKPPAGTKVSGGDGITLVVSKGTDKTVSVPTVSKTTFSGAVTILQASGLRATEKLVTNTRPGGTVLKQTPAAGTKVKPNSVVVLTVSKQNAVALPTVVGKTATTAGNILGGAGLTVAGTTAHCSTTYGSGIVSSQNPPGGTQVAPHSGVNLVLSNGPCTAVVPTVRGQTPDKAKATLASKGFATVTTSATNKCPGSTSGKVISQTPTGGRTQATTITVMLTVCTTPPPTTTTTSATTSTTTTTTAPKTTNK